jgi:glycine/D-amino acid oxidase-like deaminating enzyme
MNTQQADVAVIGAGIVGVACAYYLLSRDVNARAEGRAGRSSPDFTMNTAGCRFR